MTKFYFAYGSNMDEAQMASRCPGAEVCGRASLPGYRFVINDRGVATLLACTGAWTPGLLWRINEEHEHSLDDYEGYAAGCYDKCMRVVREARGCEHTALVYIAPLAFPLGAPRDGYLERIVKAAKAHNLPKSHVMFLRTWPRVREFEVFNQFLDCMKAEVPGTVDPPAILSRWGGRRCWEDTLSGAFRSNIVDMLKAQRDRLVLAALEEIFCAEEEELCELDEETRREVLETDEPVPLWFEQAFLRRVLAAAQNREMELTEAYATRAAFAHYELARFLEYVESLRKDHYLPAALSRAHKAEELADAGVIITADPARPHGPSDRFIVTEYAPLLGDLWNRVFFSGNGVSPRTCPHIDAFVDAASSDSATDIVFQALHRVAILTRDAMDAIGKELDKHVGTGLGCEVYTPF